MTTRLYYGDAYLSKFRARIVERGCDPCEVYLDQTAFYPSSGGQPYDTGTIAGVPVIDVIDEGERIQHRIARPVNAADVDCEIDWPRRFDHMQQHSGQHLLSAVFTELGGWQTESFHLGATVSTLDLDAESLDADQLRAAESRANELVAANLPLSVSFEQAEHAEGLRRATEREGMLRIVSIGTIDRSACGGTHVRSTGEIGLILLRKTEKVHGRARVEFLCGGRAVRRAREDFDALSEIARTLSAPADEAPAMVATMQIRLAEAERNDRRLRRELAQLRGEKLHRETEPGEDGLRVVIRQLDGGPVGDDDRAEAQSFTSCPMAVMAIMSAEPATALLAASGDSGIHAGKLLGECLAKAGGRGGGNAQLAQGRLSDAWAVEQFSEMLRAEISRRRPG